ncbi:MAG: radical SAM family heme chaperone HemW [Rickettsiaceae bacterium]|nr:radical SAM family heme chaperone HemW [Rickettsiaceae bacterium]
MQKNLSIYIHWPFCLSLCPYCDFNSHISDSIDEQAWIESYIKELSYFLESFEGGDIESIFFGGGTPSLMSPKLVGKILTYISSIKPIDKAEITLEANPTSSEAAKFRGFKNAGINRVSIGIQALRDNDLIRLGRKHSAQEGVKAIEMASKIFDNFSFDLIYGREGQNIQDWESELNEAINFSSPHISLYLLTIEKGTPFYKLHREGALKLPSNELCADLLNATTNILDTKGFKRYEISNYAKNGYESRHNLAYWKYKDYIGIGPGAYSRISSGGNSSSAIMTHHNPQKWLSEVAANGHGIQKNTLLNMGERISEIVMMGLRIKSGIDEALLFHMTQKKFLDILDLNYLSFLEKEGFVVYDKNEGRIYLTDSGMNLHSFITSRILL